MPILRAQLTIPTRSNIVADSIVNTFHFRATASDGATHDALASALATAYGFIQNHLSGKLNGVKARLKLFELGRPTPNPPVYDELFLLGDTTATSTYPAELAICLSFQGTKVAGIPQARRRGRVYLGPWSQSDEVTNFERVGAVLQGRIRDVGKSLLDASTAAPGWSWVVFSPTTDELTTEDVASTDVVEVWVDNAWDIQRRRGVLPDLRLMYPV